MFRPYFGHLQEVHTIYMYKKLINLLITSNNITRHVYYHYLGVDVIIYINNS
jgi:hypothetical protein